MNRFLFIQDDNQRSQAKRFNPKIYFRKSLRDDSVQTGVYKTKRDFEWLLCGFYDNPAKFWKRVSYVFRS